ncbi:unnamed protein product [Orchesella dallaii]|uniref:TIP41-like protein n=1 Tax=Orchesella dallaii TaxID=48710 RepID=A0ABP1PUR9_9HEXA
MDGGGRDEISSPASASSRRKSNGKSVVGAVQYARRVNEQSYTFDGWQITVLKSPILPSNCYCSILDKDNTKGLLFELGCKLEDIQFPSTNSETSSTQTVPVVKCHVCRYTEQLNLKHLPDMVFPDNYLHLRHEASGLILEFNTLDAMKLMSTQDTESLQIACSKDWQASQTEMGLPKEVLHDFNWTFSTDYMGTLKSSNAATEVNVISNPPEEINMEKLKQREQILFYDELTLYEDELHDNGISNLNVKLRVMPSGFFILLRHTLRVDHVMARICDTRVHYEAGNNYFLRQSQTKQESFKNLGNMDPHQFSDINALAQFLPVTKETTEKILIQ